MLVPVLSPDILLPKLYTIVSLTEKFRNRWNVRIGRDAFDKGAIDIDVTDMEEFDKLSSRDCPIATLGGAW